MKILILASEAQSLVNFRGDLICSLVERGHLVAVCASRLTPEAEDFFRRKTIPYHDWPELRRVSLNPFWDVLAALQLRKIIRKVSPDAILAYTIKPVILGLTAAAACGVPRRISLITGLGSPFHGPGLRGLLLKQVAALLYRWALRSATKIAVQNEDIRVVFRAMKIVPAERSVSVIEGSGVNTNRFRFSRHPGGPPVFLFLGRLLHDKGIREFVGAAERLKLIFPKARFLVAGGIDKNPSAVSSSQIDAWVTGGAIECLGEVKDVVTLLRSATVLVHPSYHEGLPRAVLEAMATGRPIVTTDAIGCRETITNPEPPNALGLRVGRNGILVPVRSTDALFEALRMLATNPQLCEAMGAASRDIAVERFDVRLINAKMIELLESGGI
jgi:glycosyltransferase involved in cell wall biosynthesis